jgi:hypothetical protein
MEPTEIIIDPEFQKLIPALTPDERKDLEASLIADGCISPLVIWYKHNILLDGHNRHELCLKHDIECEVHEIVLASREDAKAWIIKHQLGRRNLDQSQRALLATTLEDVYGQQAKVRMAEGGKLGGQSSAKGTAKLPDPSKGEARERAAADMNVSPRLVSAAKKVVEKGSPRLQEAVRNGEVSVSAAAKVATLPKPRQDELVDMGPKAVRKAAAKIGKKHAAAASATEISPDALTPVRDAVPLPAKTALDLPHDPVWAAKTLISVFDREFLVGLVSEITLFLQGDSK